jgi:hypothetical protein
MELRTEPSTTVKIKNPKKVEAGRKAALARAKKLEELKRLAAASQQRVHAEIVKDSQQGGDVAYEKPAPSQSNRGADHKWSMQIVWLAGGSLMLLAGLIFYRKKMTTNSGSSEPDPDVPPPVAPPPVAPPPVAKPPVAKPPAASYATASPQPESTRQMYAASME